MDLSEVETARKSGWNALGDDEVANRVRGALLGSACGDALGRPFDGVGEVDESEYRRHRDRTMMLSYSGGTVMVLALAQHLSSRLARGAELEETALVHDLAWAWRRAVCRSLGCGSEDVLRAALVGAPWPAVAGGLFDGAGSDGNGAAARVVAVGLLGLPVRQVMDWARRSARVTHQHPHGHAGAALQAVAVALAAGSDRMKPSVADRFIEALCACDLETGYLSRLSRIWALAGNESPDRTRRALGSGPSALQSVPTAIAAFLHAPDDPDEVLDFAVRVGGDTGTIAAMAGALAGARCGATGLPTEVLGRLEIGPLIRAAADTLTRCAVLTGSPALLRAGDVPRDPAGGR